MEFKNKLKNIYKYFGISLPLWMESRKTLFIFSLVDFIFIYQIFKDLYIKNNVEINFIRTFYFLIIWSLLSYINGRYSYLTKLKTNIKKIYKLFINTSIVCLLSYALDKTLIIFFSNWTPLGRDNILKIFIISFLIQALKFLVKNPLTVKEHIFLLGSEDKIKDFMKYCGDYLKNRKLEVHNYSEINKKFNKLKTIVLLDSNNDIFRNFTYLISEKSEIITASQWCEKNLQRIPIEYLTTNDIDINTYINSPQNFKWRLKRFGDIVVSFILLIITSPVILISALLIKIEDQGPIFYSQKRTGIYGENFNIFKLRSMKKNSEKEGPVWAKSDDPRVTKVGKILRKSRIDELPQLWAVIKGEMSLIGPRPERPEIEKLLIKEIPFYNLRSTIRPGLSGWAQVNYRYGSSIQDSKNKFSYEIFYLRNYSFLLDILIFFKTLKLVIKMEGSNPK